MRARMGCVAGCVMLVVACASCRAPVEQTTVPADEPVVTPQETPGTPLGTIARIDPGPMRKESPDARHLAWVVEDDDGVHVSIDGEWGPAFERIARIENHSGCFVLPACAEWSRDGEHVAYVAVIDGLSHAVIDGEISETGYETVDIEEWRAFSPDGSRFAYIGVSDKGTRIVADGEDRTYVAVIDGVSYPVIDGEISETSHETVDIGELGALIPAAPRVTYVGVVGTECRMVVDGEPGPMFHRISSPVFSPDSRRLAYVGSHNSDGDTLIVDGEAIATAEKIDSHSLQFSPDGERLVYAVSEPEPKLFVDGKVWPLEHGVLLWTPVFSDDSWHLAYVDGEPQGTCRVLVDGVAGGTYRDVGRLQFAPDGETVWYWARQGWDEERVVMGDDISPVYDEVEATPWASLQLPLKGPAPVFSKNGEHYAYVARKGDESFVVLDGKEQERYPDVLLVRFSPDGNKLAHWVELADGRYAMVVNGEIVGEHGGCGPPPIFSPDSRRMAYEVHVGEAPRRQEHYVIDGDEHPGGEFVSHLEFSDDSQHYAYTVTERRGREWMVLDGEAGPTFETDGSVRYIGVRDETVYRVIQVPPK